MNLKTRRVGKLYIINKLSKLINDIIKQLEKNIVKHPIVIVSNIGDYYEHNNLFIDRKHKNILIKAILYHYYEQTDEEILKYCFEEIDFLGVIKGKITKRNDKLFCESVIKYFKSYNYITSL